ncbi:hypothetical protein BS50DRAFT_569308 [Corynespora cassiicola Philippines]|uniref:ATPase inhibitor, mitochondrial n=1 Tax=Corynespora cassiicola Philippines TaxID=1448308 RepID=A0A2T2P1W0_CORCC|nr:hypothetical protein BS50DRAFT_569308 [Corynespora cassiicola Philippines]
MFRSAIIKSARPMASRRMLSTSARLMSAGDVGSGASRPGGSRGGDAFTKREAAAEELYIRQEEKAKLLAIREKLKQQQAHIEELTKHMFVAPLPTASFPVRWPSRAGRACVVRTEPFGRMAWHCPDTARPALGCYR